MSLDSFAHLYEEATIDVARHAILCMLNDHLPPLRPDMHILDLACGSGSVTRVIYEQCEAKGLQPPKITGVDVGPNFITAFNENKAARNWHTASAFVCDASDLSPLQDNTFDIVIMSFALFILDTKASASAAEIRRVLKPGGHAAITTWRENWVERMFVGANEAIGYTEVAERFKMTKWDKMETGRDALLAGGFEADKVQHSRVDFQYTFDTVDDFLDRFSTPFWLGMAARSWTEEQKPQWRGEIAKLVTEEEKNKGEVPIGLWLFIVKK
jgi:ubiquinone/menaquinone biosynthesis C-methylase UbiE